MFETISAGRAHSVSLLAACALGSLLAAACGNSSDGGGSNATAGSATNSAGSAGSASTPGGSGAIGAGGTSSSTSGGTSGGAIQASASSAGQGGGGGTNSGEFAGNGGASGGGATSNGGAAGSGGSTDTDYLKTRTNGYGFVDIAASSKNQILSFATTLTVPTKPAMNTGTLFLWPGLQPGGANFDPIDNGVLQPVLTWGPTCAPNAPRNAYASWWISAQYVNTYGHDTGYTGCLGGDGMNVAVGDALAIVMTLNGTAWHQAVTDAASNQTVTYDIDMLGQAQNYAEFVIEQYTQDPAGDVIFTNNVVTFANSEPSACQPTVRGTNDFFTNPKASADGKTCTIDRVVLRAEGVPATTQN
ncbi:MAG TPA: hypothetical protein VHV51_12480 [Polyangiaceae bacterium]|jgi:hypothetical protein|nr:hypothetical protein [Polyangiaceae bacterium]